MIYPSSAASFYLGFRRECRNRNKAALSTSESLGPRAVGFFGVP
jgi:hypothetical protein